MAGTMVFIPAWNEEASLPGVLSDARRVLPEADLLVIDDGSTDQTAAVARAHGADVVSFSTNRGLKAGIAEGYRQALKRGYDYCGRLDADGQHPAEELARMLALVRPARCDVAIGSRFLPGFRQGRRALQARPRARVRHVAAAAPDAAAARAADIRRHQRPVRGRPLRAGAARRRLHLRGPGGRGAACGSPTPSCGSWRCPCTCASASTASPRSRAGGRRARRHDRDDAVRRRAAAGPPPAPPAPRPGPRAQAGAAGRSPLSPW